MKLKISWKENRVIFLKGTTRKITRQKEGFLIFLRPLMAAGLPLIKSEITPLAKSYLLPLRLSPGMSVADTVTYIKSLWIRNYGINNFK